MQVKVNLPKLDVLAQSPLPGLEVKYGDETRHITLQRTDLRENSINKGSVTISLDRL